MGGQTRVLCTELFLVIMLYRASPQTGELSCMYLEHIPEISFDGGRVGLDGKMAERKDLPALGRANSTHPLKSAAVYN